MRNFIVKLTSLDLSSFNTENVTSMYAMFYKCPKLTPLDLSNFNTQKVENMYLMFYNCTNLAFLDLSGFDTQNVTNMSYMFTGCNNVEKIYVDENWTTENVQASDAMFNFCLKLVGQDGTKYEYPKTLPMHIIRKMVTSHACQRLMPYLKMILSLSIMIS